VQVRDETERLYRRLLEAWNRADAEEMAGCFEAEGEMIGFDGSEARGITEIGEHLRSVFTDHQTATFVAKIRSIRELAADVSLLRAAAGMVPPGASDINPDVNVHHTVIARKNADEWLITLFQNTPAQFHGRPELTEKWTEEMRELL
jgi:uncharacterized protein (TIGR02246 family)